LRRNEILRREATFTGEEGKLEVRYFVGGKIVI
jgi:hypothetical protein